VGDRSRDRAKANAIAGAEASRCEMPRKGKASASRKITIFLINATFSAPAKFAGDQAGTLHENASIHRSKRKATVRLCFNSSPLAVFPDSK
jgi:hypothetical protein